MKVYILDTSGEILNKILKWLANNKKVSYIAFFDDSAKFIENVVREKPELVFIRIEANDTQGVGVANFIKSMQPNIKIVFISDKKCCAMDAYDTETYEEMISPAEKKEFDKILSSVMDNLLQVRVRQYFDHREKPVMS